MRGALWVVLVLFVSVACTSTPSPSAASSSGGASSTGTSAIQSETGADIVYNRGTHPDGSGRRRIVSSADGSFSFEPAWSPDSSKLLFVRREPDYRDGSELWMVNIDGTGFHQVTHTAAIGDDEYSGVGVAPAHEMRS